jgi:hypothetical protein
MSAEKSVERLSGKRRNNSLHEQRNVIPAQRNELEVTRLAKGEHSDVSNEDLELSFFDNPYIKILIRLGRHQPHCHLF